MIKQSVIEAAEILLPAEDLQSTLEFSAKNWDSVCFLFFLRMLPIVHRWRVME